MLHEEILTPETFKLLKRIMQDDTFKDFILVGGTAISLFLGHRKSIDLDLFTPEDFSSRELEDYLSDEYDFVESFRAKNTLKGTIDGVFIDCITYKYPLSRPVVNEDKTRICSLADISAMKLSAITDSWSRLKDFVDIAYLSTVLSLNDMLDAYTKRFKSSNFVSTLKALVYYDDIKGDEPILLLKGKYDFKLIDKRIREMIKQPSLIFSTYPIK